MSEGQVRPMLQVLASFTASFTPGASIQQAVTSKGLTPSAVFDPSAGLPATLYSNDSNSIALDGNTRLLGVGSFNYAFDVTNTVWIRNEQLQNSSTDALVAADHKPLYTASLLYSVDEGDGLLYRVQSSTDNADALGTSNHGHLSTLAHLLGFNGTSWDRIRAPNVFKFVAATASGNTTVWTPTTGKKFRVLGGEISIAGTLAATGVQVIKLTDGAGGTEIARFNAAVLDTLTGDTQIPFTLGNGYLSGAANNLLVVNLGTAMATGSVIVNVYGTEE